MPTLRLLRVLLAGCFATPALAAAAPPFGADAVHDQSEYALGSYVHNVVFVQDRQERDVNDATHPVLAGGSRIHWTDAQIADTTTAIRGAIDFWNRASAARHHENARLDIRLNFVNGSEPVTVGNVDEAAASYDNVLHKLDDKYRSGGQNATIQQFNADTRASFGTDWAVTSFVKPFSGRASAFINGSYTNGFSDDNTFTWAHELGHTFGALDEYGDRRTDRHSGYLWGDTPNAALLPDGSPNPDSRDSLMKTWGSFAFSEGTLRQIGWVDSDGDTIPDILDTFPTLTADTAGSSLEEGRLRLDLDASVTPMASPDPWEGDYTINTLAEARYRLDGGAWASLIADDGETDDAVEGFTLALDGLRTRGFSVDLEVLNSVGNASFRTLAFGVVPEPVLLPLAAAGVLLVRRRVSPG